jgi:ketosteroid isomerase-like protein
MSQENVKVVRGFFGAMERFFESYSKNPRSLVAAEESGDLWPEYEEALGYADPVVEWQTVFLGATHRGRREIARAWDDFLRWTEGYKIRLQEIEDLDACRVFAVLTISSASKDGSGSFDSRHFDIVTVQDGLIVRLAEFTDREQALEAAGLSE